MVQEPSRQTSGPNPERKPRASWMHWLTGGWILAWRDLQTGLIKPFQTGSIERAGLIVIMAALVITWFIYVPIHELLHVAGCVWTGGTVSELVMGREYGAGFLKEIFPFITPATTRYAGRVTGFEPNGDIGYLVTVYAPFLLTVFPGVWFIGKAIRTGRTWLWGPGIVIGFASFTNLTGDFFEIGTIFSTRLTDMLTSGFASQNALMFWELRSDDIFRLIGEISADPAAYGINGTPGAVIAGLTILLGLFLAIVFTGWTYAAGRALAGVPAAPGRFDETG